MKGAGDYLHEGILEWSGQDFRAGCGCEDIVRRMNERGPAWCSRPRNFNWIVAKLVKASHTRGWWGYATMIPGSHFFLRRLVLEALAKAERWRL